MKSLIQICFSIACVSLLLTSCASDPCGNNKDAFLKKFDNLVENIEAIDYDTENPKWEGYNENFKKMVDECYEIHEDDLSRREEREFGKQVAVYYVKTFSGQVDFEKEAAELGKLIGDNMEGISSEIGDALKDIDININLEDGEIEELFEELGSDIEKMGEKWGKKLEKILEKE